MPPVRILFVGDMHLGRRASRVPAAAWRDQGLDDDVVTALGAWHRTVAAALEHGVAAVALAGDLVHQDDDLFEARGHLEDGIRRLTAAGIRVCAVTGNHDTRVLPVLADVIPELELLGPQGTWSGIAVADGVRIVGWSFPNRHHAASPLRDRPPAPDPREVTLGLLHADLDVASSRYAPVARADLAAVGYQGWAVGHVHAPDPVPDPGEVRPFYLGSIAGLTPNETGAHGPVLATIAAGRVSWERIPLAPLRWEHVDLAVDGLAWPDDAPVTFLRNHLLGAGAADLLQGAPRTDLLGLRITLVGDHPRAAAIARTAGDLATEDLVTRDPSGGVVFIDRVTSAVRTPIDLVRLADRSDPAGLLARQVLDLESAAPACEPLLARARLAVGEMPPDPADAASAWSDDDLRRGLAAAGRRALDALLAQPEDRP